MAGPGDSDASAHELIHDLHNALGIVITYSSLVLEVVEDRPQVAADVTEIRKAGQHAAELVGLLSARLRDHPPPG